MVLLLIIIGFAVPFIPVTKTEAVSYVSNKEQSTPVFQISSYTIDANHWVYQTASLSVGEDIQVSYSASDTVNAYLFSSSQYSSYSGQSNPSSEVAQTGQASGTISFRVSASDTYYLVIFNPHNGFLGLGSHSVGLYSAGGTAASLAAVTLTSTTATSCNQSLISYLSGGNC